MNERNKGTGCGWFRELALDSEEVHFFSRSKASQLQVLEDFIRDSLALVKYIESPMTHEQAFLHAIFRCPSDDGPRLIYADWLEERGDEESAAKAEFIRLEYSLSSLKPDGEEYVRRRARLREIAQSIGLSWCAGVSKSALENCRLSFKFECPKKWEQLTLTGDPMERFCESCGKGVYYCASIKEAREHAQVGQCIAVDCRVDRRPGDLEPPMRWATLGIALPEGRGGSQRGGEES